MEKDKIFFDENDLTTTSANHIANMAKEAYQTLEQELSNLKLYSGESLRLCALSQVFVFAIVIVFSAIVTLLTQHLPH